MRQYIRENKTKFVQKFIHSKSCTHEKITETISYRILKYLGKVEKDEEIFFIVHMQFKRINRNHAHTIINAHSGKVMEKQAKNLPHRP